MKDKIFDELMNKAFKSQCTCEVCSLLKQWIKESIIEYRLLHNDCY